MSRFPRGSPWVPAVVLQARLRHDAGMTFTVEPQACGDAAVIKIDDAPDRLNPARAIQSLYIDFASDCGTARLAASNLRTNLWARTGFRFKISTFG